MTINDLISRRKTLRSSVLAALGLGLSAASRGFAQSYPEKPVRIIVPYPAGAAADVMIRSIGQRLADKFGQQFVIDNRAGGGGIAATKAVADAAPDGYTLLFTGPNHVTNLGLYKNVPYDPIAEFAPVTQVASAQSVFVANAATGFKSIYQVVSAAKAQPGLLNYASSGTGTGTHLAMEMLMRATGTKFAHIAYKGGTPAAAAIAAGEVQVGFSIVPLVKPLVDSKRLVPLLVGGTKRLAAFPGVPSLGELGMNNFDVDIWFGLMAPKRVPAAILDALSAEIRRVLTDSVVKERFASIGFSVVGSTAPEFDMLVRKEAQRWPQLIRELGIQPG